MSEFIKRFKSRGNITFLGMRDTAISMLPSDRMVLDKLYNDLKRGTGILDDEIHLNMYLRCFGKMHKAKLDTAFGCIPDDTELFSNQIEIYDWGCGQGIATICLLDYLKANHINYDIKSIHLIEPSTAAVKRACDVIECMDADISVATTTKVFDKLNMYKLFKENTHRNSPFFQPCTFLSVHDSKHCIWCRCCDKFIYTSIVAIIWTNAYKVVCATETLLEQVDKTCQIKTVDIQYVTEQMQLYCFRWNKVCLL